MARVKLMSPQLRERCGAKQVEIEADDVDEVLTRLQVDRNRDLRVLVNGRAIGHLDGAATRIGEDDTVTIYSIGIRGWPGG
jgi:molybdopterin converting factor small subunit